MKTFSRSTKYLCQQKPSGQRGASLVTTMIILLIVLLMAFAASRISLNQLQTAGRYQFQQTALDRAEAGVAQAETWLAQTAADNWNSLGFESYDAATTPHLYPAGELALKGYRPISMTLADANSLTVDATSRYLIEKIGSNAGLPGDNSSIGTKQTEACAAVQLFGVYGFGASAKESRRVVRTVYSVPGCSK